MPDFNVMPVILYCGMLSEEESEDKGDVQGMDSASGDGGEDGSDGGTFGLVVLRGIRDLSTGASFSARNL